MSDVLRVTTHASVLATKNELAQVNQRYFKEDVTFTELTHMRVTLGTNMASPQEIDMTGGDGLSFTGARVMIQTDRAIDVALDSSANLVSLPDNGMIMAVASFTHVYVLNNSTTYAANIEVVVTD